ncbi:restriction endonuclease subunit S [Enterococcus faecalis]|uniref:restriction endonuclease subunit S n=1 Tax=Enterococcus faecalis TaxID=1351 RepID=UPI002441806C|nr:restriction endonuclease subunit S [Enterococcus faecalis]MDH5039496.1 restriction endonuclease subunit S [Enterococcus faecalis]
MMSKKSPQLRFEGFTDDWEQRKFQWLIDQNIIDSPIDGNHGEKHPKSSDYVESGIPFLMAKDIKNNKIDIKNCTFISKETAEALDKGFAKNGDILLTHKATIGEVGILEGVNTEYAMLTPQITYYRILDFSRLDRNFFSSVLRSSVFQKNIHKIAKQSTRPYVGITEQRKLTIYFPIKIEEQQKIGSFFKQIDETIALHQRKLDLLKEQKKGYLQKMFPKNGAKVPELRFAGFADDWEERKLKDVVEKQIKGKAQFEKLAQGDVEYLDTSRLNGGQAILTNGLKDVTLDDILILWDGSKAGTVYHGFEGALGSTLKAYRTSANSKFVYQYLKRHQDNIYNNYRTPNIPHVQKDFLNVFTISVPGSDEQAKIGSFFKKLDDTIALHQRKLDLLKEQKKGFLQKMFV